MSLLVIKPGVQTLLQDAGRPGYARFGVARCGAFDRGAWARANQLVGNPVPPAEQGDGPATLEILFGGLVIQAESPLLVAVTGAEVVVTVTGPEGSRTVPTDTACRLAAGETLSLGRARAGLRCYLAVAGGFAATATLGSRSFDTTARLGPPPLAAGDLLTALPATGDGPPEATGPTHAEPLPDGDITELPAAPGPRADLLAPQAQVDPWEVSPTSSRAGVRLVAVSPAAKSAAPVAALPSEPALPGAVQALPSGELVVFGPDAPTTGGYPVVAVVGRTGLDRLAQCRPGSRVRLRISQD